MNTDILCDQVIQSRKEQGTMYSNNKLSIITVATWAHPHCRNLLIHRCTHPHSIVSIHDHTDTYTETHVHRNTQTYAHTWTRTHTHAHTHTHTYTHALTCTHTHVRICSVYKNSPRHCLNIKIKNHKVLRYMYKLKPIYM